MARPRSNVAYIVNKELIQVSSQLPANQNRSLLVHSLVQALGLLRQPSKDFDDSLHRPIRVVNPQPASYEALAVYHTGEYLDRVLKRPKISTDDIATDEDNLGLEDDCPSFPGLDRYVTLVAGASLTAVQALKKGFADVAIAWDGGRHHAQKARASGFCYVADCVLAILALKKAPMVPVVSLDRDTTILEKDDSPTSSAPRARKPRVMYLDLDLHFSDGVSHAFHNPNLASGGSSQVLTLSIHHAAPGFFPVSPLSALPPIPNPNIFHLAPSPPHDPYTLSLPLHPGYNNATIARIWPSVERVRDAFAPDYVVLQCGVDALAGDKCGIGGWSLGGADEDEDAEGEEKMNVDGRPQLAPGSFGWCVDRVVNQWGVKTLLLGGGGYNHPNAARAYAYLTSIALNRPLPLGTQVPDHTFFPAYAQSFILDVPPSTMQDQNTEAYLREVEAAFQASATILSERRRKVEGTP